jgi:hypothetical protein
MASRTLSPRSVGNPIVIAGVVVGIVDIVAAFAVRYSFGAVSPVRVLQGIASGVMGPAAFRGGPATAALGMLLHFVIAFAVAGVYYAVSRKWRLLLHHPAVSGTLYGIAVHAVMNVIVLPLSHFPSGPRTPPLSFTLTMVLVHVFCVGLPISFIVARDEPTRFTAVERHQV